jgi:hypothetical protein
MITSQQHLTSGLLPVKFPERDVVYQEGQPHRLSHNAFRETLVRTTSFLRLHSKQEPGNSERTDEQMENDHR